MALRMASSECAEGPNGLSLESSLMSGERFTCAAADVPGALAAPISRAGLETRSKKRLMLAASCHGRLRPRHWFIAGGAQAVNFLQSQFAEFSRRNIERKRPVAHALNLPHMMSDFFEHAPNLP